MTRTLYLVTLGGRTRAVPRHEAYVTTYYPSWMNQLPPGFRRLKNGERPQPGDFAYWSGLDAYSHRLRGWHLLDGDDLDYIARVWKRADATSFSAQNWTATCITRRPK